MWKEVGGTRTYFFYSEEGLIAEYDGSGNELRSYGYRPDATWTTNPLWLKQNGAYYRYQHDHLGTPQTLIDMTGTVAWSAQYSAFGEAQIDVETITNNLRFPGQYYDAETGLHYNYQRSYDPQSGRYTQADPLGFDAGDVNWYAYVGNNPVNEIDPLGLITGVEVAAACLATSPCREIVVAGTAAAALAVGKAAQDVYNSLPPVYIPPMPPLGAPPVEIPGYPDIRPRSPLFPRMPSMAEVCDPEVDKRDLEKMKRQAEKSTPKLRPGKSGGPRIPGEACDELWRIIHDPNSSFSQKMLATTLYYGGGCHDLD